MDPLSADASMTATVLKYHATVHDPQILELLCFLLKSCTFYRSLIFVKNAYYYLLLKIFSCVVISSLLAFDDGVINAECYENLTLILDFDNELILSLSSDETFLGDDIVKILGSY